MNLRKLQVKNDVESTETPKHLDLTAVGGNKAFQIFAQAYYETVRPEDEDVEAEWNFVKCLEE